MRVLVDADPIVYAAGFVSEDVFYEGVAWNDEGEEVQFRVRPGEEYAKLKARWKYIDKDRVAVAHPVSEALLATNSIIDSIRRNIAEKCGIAEKHVSISPFLTGNSNFREAIAKQKPYKGNRDKSVRPIHYQRIRDHLERRLRAKVVDGREADDEVSIQGWATYLNDNDSCVIASIDKDLDQIPGVHYDYKKHVFYTVTMEDARRAFWIQAISGDSGDNVPGCWKMGLEKAAQIVDKWIKDGLSDEQIWESVVTLYNKSRTIKGCPYANVDAKTVARETAQLVYLQQWRGELWEPPGVERGTVAGDNDD